MKMWHMHKTRGIFVFGILFVSVFLRGTTCHNGTHLHNDLFKNYKPEVRPCKQYGKPLDIEIRFNLIKIFNVDEITQTLSTVVTMTIDWRDDLLMWEPSGYSDIKHIILPFSSVWTPDIIIINAAETPGDIGQKYAKVKVNHDGIIQVWTQANLKTQCNIATKNYPFDVQICSINFNTFLTDDKEFNLRQNMNKTSLKYYEKTAEWDIIGNFVSVEKSIANDQGLGNYTVLKYYLKLQRQCLSCILNVILPVVLLGCLNLLTFFVPSDSGEKMSFPVSIFLTLAVFLTVITLSLPESIDGLSYLGMYVTFELGTGVTTLACSVITLRLFQRDEMENKRYLHILLVKTFGPRVPKKCTVKKTGKPFTDNDILDNPRTHASQESGVDSVDVKCRTNTDEAHTDNGGDPRESAIMWTDVSKAFDICVFTITAILQMLVLFLFLFMIST